MKLSIQEFIDAFARIIVTYTNAKRCNYGAQVANEDTVDTEDLSYLDDSTVMVNLPPINPEDYANFRVVSDQQIKRFLTKGKLESFPEFFNRVYDYLSEDSIAYLAAQTSWKVGKFDHLNYFLQTYSQLLLRFQDVENFKDADWNDLSDLLKSSGKVLFQLANKEDKVAIKKLPNDVDPKVKQEKSAFIDGKLGHCCFEWSSSKGFTQVGTAIVTIIDALDCKNYEEYCKKVDKAIDDYELNFLKKQIRKLTRALATLNEQMVSLQRGLSYVPSDDNALEILENKEEAQNQQEITILQTRVANLERQVQELMTMMVQLQEALVKVTERMDKREAIEKAQIKAQDERKNERLEFLEKQVALLMSAKVDTPPMMNALDNISDVTLDDDSFKSKADDEVGFVGKVYNFFTDDGSLQSQKSNDQEEIGIGQTKDKTSKVSVDIPNL